MLRRVLAKTPSAMMVKQSALLSSQRASLSTSHTFDIAGSYELHNFETGPAEKVEMTKDEFVNIFETMYTMRRMEITCDNEYKARNIRGFCHLYDGQEAVATGIQT